MAFMICYDSNDEQSLVEAETLHTQLRDEIREARKRQANFEPVVYLIGTKIDKVKVAHDGSAATRDYAKKYCQNQHIVWEEISAFDYQKVRNLFRKVMLSIQEREYLWTRPKVESTS